LAFKKYFKNASPMPMENMVSISEVMMNPDANNQNNGLKLIRKMRLKTAIVWSVLALLLIIITIKTFKKK
jgi:t-SNARE complex subunit (syntaxin)